MIEKIDWEKYADSFDRIDEIQNEEVYNLSVTNFTVETDQSGIRKKEQQEEDRTQ